MTTTVSTVAARLPRELLTVLLRVPPRQRQRILQAPSLHGSQRELFRDACAMTKAGISHEEQVRILETRFGDYYRPLQNREIENAVRSSFASGDRVLRRQYPEPNPGARAKVTARCSGALEQLRSQSPVASPHLIPSSEVIDRFFGEESLLCMGSAPERTSTDKRGRFRGLEAGLPYMVPNAMSAERGMTKDGRISNRCLSNVGPRSRIVVEYDSGSLDEQAALHLHFRENHVPLRMVVFSGSKSLHGWFDVSALSPREINQIRRYAAYLGADRATFSPIQLVRTPNARRDGKVLQAVQYLS